MKVKNRRSVVLYALIASMVVVVMTLLHIHINYPPEFREVVRVKAMIAAFVISMAMNSWIFEQARQNFELTVELERLVNRDRLTDIATRDFFFTRMQADEDTSGVTLMADIDHFKSINDQYGHLVGDQVIQMVATSLRDMTRENDIVCRFGGEEFLVFLSGRSKDEGLAAAERMRKAISEQAIEAGGAQIQVTVSIGASMKDSQSDVMRAIQAADLALYRAKEAGRNRSWFAPLQSQAPMAGTA